MVKKFLSRGEYLDKQRQAIIEQSLENSRNRILPAVPLVLKESEKEWKENINKLIEVAKSGLNDAIQYNHGKDKVDGWQNELNRLTDKLNKGYTEELCAGGSCIYTATDNYGKKYRVSGNKTFRANPAKYGFEEINLNDIKPGDIIQDFGPNGPRHALTFVGYDDTNKALFNYSKGGSNESEIVKNGHYDFEWDELEPTVHLDGINNDKLRHTAAAYRFIGTEDDNKLWNENYNKERSDWSKQVIEELRKVPTLTLPNQVQIMKFGGMKQDKVFKLKGGVAIPLDKANKLFYLSGAKHEQGGIDVTPELEAEGGEVVKINPKSIKVVTAQKIMGGKSPAELVVDASSTGKSEKVFNKVFDYQEDFKDRHNLNDDGTKKAKFGKILNKLSNFYWHTLRAPKDYSEEVATLRNGCTTTECAKWSNDQLQKAGLSIFGDAWTRSSNKGIKKIYSGYDVSKRPKQYNKEEVINYTLSAADSLAKTLDINQLKQNDIVGLYFRNSPNIETAYNKGTNGETQTHTGHVVIDEDRIPFVVHNVHGNIVKNKAEDLIGSKHPYGITSVYRKELGGQMKKKYKIGGNVNVHSTGKKIKAKYGTRDKLVTDFLNQTLDEINSTDYSTEFGLPSVSFTAPKLKVNDTSSIVVPDGYYKTKNGAIFKDFENKNTNKLGLTTGDWINAGVNIGGALINLASRHSLPQKAIKYKSPIPLTAIKGKTKININPQLREIDKTINKYTDTINKNTASSRVSLNRLRDLNLNRLDMVNKLYAQKENQETALINQDNRNLQNIINQNIQAQNIIDQKNLENEIQTVNLNRLERADAITDFVQNIAQTTGNVLSNVEKRKQFDKNLITMGLSYPNLNIDELLKVIGLR